jgi:hypothetical protein
MEDLSAKGASMNPDWRLVGSCDVGDGTGTRAPLATAPEPDDRTPLEADLSLLFPWGFLMIGLRFVLRGLLALGGAVSTDPNAAHGADAPLHGPDVAVEPPIVERRVDEEAKAHEGEHALPPDDLNVKDALDAAKARVEAGASDADNAKKELGGERPHHAVADVSAPAPELDSWMVAPVAQKKALSSRPPPDVPTAPKLEVAQALAEEEEDERTLVGDLSELAKAQEDIEAQNKIRDEEKKKGGKG